METAVRFQSDGIELAGILGYPELHRPQEKRPAFIVLHGFVGSKDDSHAELQARMLSDFGYATLRFDMRGCGESGGKRGEIYCFDQVADTKNAMTWLSVQSGIDPHRIGVIGHSFGAAVAVYTAGVDRRFAAVISSCGWGHGERKFRGQHPTPEQWSKFAATLERGRKHRQETGEPLWVSRWDVVPIPENLRKHLSPKAQLEVTADTAQSMFDFRAEDVIANIAPRPLLLFHTADDIITPTEQSIRMFERAGQPTELMLVTGIAHFPLAGEEAPRNRALIKSWLDKHFPLPASSDSDRSGS